MEKKVQLKEQELVGQEVVLSDIYPKTDTTSIEDPSTGESLDVTIDHLLEMINNKLTRVVNSVNSRTGVVVLDADDVGLGNVDNISFSDIQDWVIDEIIKYLAKREILICMNLRQLEDVLATNDPMYDGRTFYVRQIDPSTDVKNYLGMIGKMRYDPIKKTLGTSINDNGIEDLLFSLGMMADDENLAVFVQDVKRTDKSLTYDKGFMKVNIAEGEDALYLDEDHNGLAINKNTIRTETHYFKSFYYHDDGYTINAPINKDFNFHQSGLLEEDNVDQEATLISSPYKVKYLPDVLIYINGRQCENHYWTSIYQQDPTYTTPYWKFKLHRSIAVELDKTGENYDHEKLHDGDTIIIQGPIQTEMLHDGIYANNDKTSPSLKFQPTLMGTIHLNINGQSSIYDANDGNVKIDNVYLELHPISQYPSWGLESKAISHVKALNLSENSQVSPQMLSNIQISTAGNIEDASGNDTNSKLSYSNIQVLADVNHFDMSKYYPTSQSTKEVYKKTSPNATMNAVVTPEGIEKLYTNENDRRGGLFVPTDMSLCAMPYDKYGLDPDKYKTWKTADDETKPDKPLQSKSVSNITNWGIKSPYHFTENNYDYEGYLNPPSFLGINLMKAFIERSGSNYAVPLSGLRVVSNNNERGSDSDTLTWNSFGLYKDVDENRILRTYSKKPDPDAKETDANKVRINSFDDLVANYISGGLMVNVGKGLEILPTNVPELANYYDDFGKVNVRLGDAMKFDSYDRIQVNPGHGLKIDDERITDDDGKFVKDDDGHYITEKRLIVDDAVIQAASLLKGYYLSGLYNENGTKNHLEAKKHDCVLDPVSLNRERFIEYRGKIELGDGLRWNYTTKDYTDMLLHDMTIYQLETLLNTDFERYDGTKSKLTIDNKNYDQKWSDYYTFIAGLLTNDANKDTIDLIDVLLKAEDLMYESKRYNVEYNRSTVKRCASIYRLFWDEVNNGGTDSSAAQDLPVSTLIDRYAERYGIEAGQSSDDQWHETDENGDATSNVDYIDHTTSSIMEGLNDCQKSLFNWLLNAITAIKKALSIRDLLYKENMYSATDGLQISFNNKIYNTFAARRGSDTMLGLMFQMMGFDSMELNSVKMIEKTKLKIDGVDDDGDDAKFKYIDKPSGSDKYTDHEIAPFDILAIRDKDGANGNMMVYTHMDEGSHLYGFTFGNTNNNFMDTICDLERVIEGAITSLTYGADGGIGQSPYGDELLTLSNVYAVLRLNKVITPESSGD